MLKSFGDSENCITFASKINLDVGKLVIRLPWTQEIVGSSPTIQTT